MKSALGNALLGMWFLAIPFALLGRYFQRISSEITTPIVYFAGLAILAPLGLVMARVDGAVLTKPTIGQGAAIAACGVLLGLGDYFTVKAFNAGGSTILVATVIALMPAAAAVIAIVLGAGAPNARTWLGWAFAAVAVVLIRGAQTPSP